MKKHQKNKMGFTLVELMISAVLIAVVSVGAAALLVHINKLGIQQQAQNLQVLEIQALCKTFTTFMEDASIDTDSIISIEDGGTRIVITTDVINRTPPVSTNLYEYAIANNNGNVDIAINDGNNISVFTMVEDAEIYFEQLFDIPSLDRYSMQVTKTPETVYSIEMIALRNFN